MLSGYWLWLGKLSKQHTGVARWLQTHTQHLAEMNCFARVLEVGSRSVFAVHQHLSSGREMRKVRMERSRMGRRGREGEVTEGTTCWNIQFENLTSGFQASPPYSCMSPLLTSCATAGRIIPPSCRGSPCPPVTLAAPHRSVSAVWSTGPDKSGKKVKTSHTFRTVHQKNPQKTKMIIYVCYYSLNKTTSKVAVSGSKKSHMSGLFQERAE